MSWSLVVAVMAVVAVLAAAGAVVVSRQRAEAARHERDAIASELDDVRRSQAEQAMGAADEDNRLAVLEQIDDQRSALLRSVSHDLRTPLATIRAVATDLRDNAAGYDPATRSDLLDTVCDEAERLDRLVGNLLSMSRIEAGALQPERQAVDVIELVADRVRRLQRLLRQVRVQLEFDEDLPLVDGDYTQLEQVFTNLLENAARHAPPASTLRVGGRRVRARGERGEQVEVWVSDEGIGVPDHLQHSIFEAFRQGEGRGSHGIGLAICKAVAEAHGGSIRVDRTPGGGATFRVVLPARRTFPQDVGRG